MFLTRRLEIFKVTKALQPRVACDTLPSQIGKVSHLEPNIPRHSSLLQPSEVLNGEMASLDIAALGQLVAHHHGGPAAKAFKTYQMDNADRVKLTAAALEVLRVFPKMPGACDLMSAALAVRLE